LAEVKDAGTVTPPQGDDGAFNGTRKLVRPVLPPSVRPPDERRRDMFFSQSPLSQAAQAEPRGVQESSHAEAFYFQKQVQQHTEMTVVLEDGEELHGVIEWYDRGVIKLRSGRRRVMIYKVGVKYMFKSSERNASHATMK
jgi:sRNA-binding regulator protein Hfq